MYFGKYIGFIGPLLFACSTAYDVICHSIQGWEWADTVGASAEKPILFHELRIKEDGQEWANHGESFVGRAHPNSPQRLSGLRRLINTHASNLLQTANEG